MKRAISTLFGPVSGRTLTEWLHSVEIYPPLREHLLVNADRLADGKAPHTRLRAVVKQFWNNQSK